MSSGHLNEGLQTSGSKNLVHKFLHEKLFIGSNLSQRNGSVFLPQSLQSQSHNTSFIIV